MKKLTSILIFALALSVFACNSGSTKTTNKEADALHISEFVNDFSSLENIEDTNPIALFKELAEQDAAEVIQLKKGNIEDILAKAKEYKHCFISLGDYTLVKVLDLDDCKQSGSWAACMPLVEGYVKKGELLYKKDYLNNIIGTPDSKERQVFLFD
jgi:hypothetical protein